MIPISVSDSADAVRSADNHSVRPGERSPGVRVAARRAQIPNDPIGNPGDAKWLCPESLPALSFESERLGTPNKEPDMATATAERDPRHHTQKMQKRLQEIKDHLRR